jgi:hypothetical protein
MQVKLNFKPTNRDPSEPSLYRFSPSLKMTHEVEREGLNGWDKTFDLSDGLYGIRHPKDLRQKKQYEGGAFIIWGGKKRVLGFDLVDKVRCHKFPEDDGFLEAINAAIPPEPEKVKVKRAKKKVVFDLKYFTDPYNDRFDRVFDFDVNGVRYLGATNSKVLVRLPCNDTETGRGNLRTATAATNLFMGKQGMEVMGLPLQALPDFERAHGPYSSMAGRKADPNDGGVQVGNARHNAAQLTLMARVMPGVQITDAIKDLAYFKWSGGDGFIMAMTGGRG